MSIMDAEELLGLHIPEEGDYDSIGGYIFHCAGCIPTQGFVIHRDEFEMEILHSNERMVEKVKITPLQNKNNNEQTF
jgi:putative hemolysin